MSPTYSRYHRPTHDRNWVLPIVSGFVASPLILLGLAAPAQAENIAPLEQMATSDLSSPEENSLEENSLKQIKPDPLMAAPENQIPVMSVSQLAESQPSPTDAMGQVTSVNQLSDVQPTDWAYQSLQSLIDRYGCIVGYSDLTYRGNRALSRYEFAAGLNACLDRVNELIAQGTANLVTKEDLAALQRLQEEYAAELATMRGQVDALEARAATLEAQQFSTTTKLAGEVAFVLADAFGEPSGRSVQTTFSQRIRLQLVTSFTGKDRLFTRLTTGNIGPSFAGRLGTQEGRFAFDGIGDNVIQLDRLHYQFPVGKNLTVTLMASLGGHHFYADTFNPGLEAGGGATGALSRFAERNPIYRLGLGGQGIGLRYQSGQFDFNAGYLARGGNVPADSSGLFAGNYSALGQVVFKPSKNFRVGLTYIHSYDPAGRRFSLGGTGTGFANFAGNVGLPGAVTSTAIASNSYGVQALYNVSPKFSIRGWFGYTSARLIGLGDADIYNYAVVLAFPDLGRKGSLGAIVFGAEPYLGSLAVPGNPSFPTSTPFHIEAFYKYNLNDNISITPGFIWLTAPNQGAIQRDVVIGTIRTTFTF